MRLLLDTHTFLWFIGGSPNLNSHVRQLIEDAGNERLISIASLWEMSIKASLGKLKLNLSFPDMVKVHVSGNAMKLLHILPEHLEIVKSMPFHHKDPFDRLLIAQSLAENMPVLSRDEVFDNYAGLRASGIKSIDMDISAVNELLLFLLRGNPDEPPPTDIAQLAEPDWDSVAQQARKHALEPLLYQQLKKRPQAVPAAVLRGLQTKYFACAWRNNNLYQELAKVLNALREEGIPVILLKGAHLVKIIYGNIALRSVGDVDVLVRKADLLKAKDALLRLGYRPSKEEDVETACANCHHLLPLMKEDAAPVELHWTVELAFAVDADGLWERARPARLDGTDTLVLSPEDLLLHLCLHSAYHHLYENGLRAFCDIREAIRHHRDELDWDAVFSRARQWDVGNSVYLTLHLAKKLLGAEVPEELLARHEPDSFSPQLIAEAERMLFGERGGCLASSSHAHLAKLLGPKSLSGAAKLFLRRLFLSREELAGRYGIPPDSPFIWLHYPLRLKDMLARHSRTMLQLWRHDEASARQLRLIDWLGR